MKMGQLHTQLARFLLCRTNGYYSFMFGADAGKFAGTNPSLRRRRVFVRVYVVFRRN